MLWLDSEVNVTESGGLVSAWDDKRNNGVGFTSSGSLRPTKSTGAITASGAQNMVNSTLTIGTSYSIFAVANLTTASGYQRLVNYRTGDYGFFFGTNDAIFATFCGNGNNSWNDTDRNTPYQSLSATYSILAATNNGTTLTPYFAKTAQSTKTGNTASLTGIVLFTGSGPASSQYWNGSLRELLIYGEALESDSRDTVFNYLSAKYSL